MRDDTYDSEAAGRRVAQLREARHWTKKELAERAGLSRVYVGAFEAGRASRPMAKTLEQLATALGWPSFAALLASREDVAPSSAASGAALRRPRFLDSGDDVVSSSPTTALAADRSPGAEAGHASGEGAGTSRMTGARRYRGFVLWGQDDPRNPASADAAWSAGRSVMREGTAGETPGNPEHIIAIRVRDVGPLSIDTASGRVGAGWRIFVDLRWRACLQEGAMVAAMSRRHRLVVGELAQDGAGEWTVLTGVLREPIDRDGLVGRVVEYQPAVPVVGWISPRSEPSPDQSEPT